MSLPHQARICVKRIYEDPEPSDGYRILIDRLWPRGIKKDRVRVDLWMKEIGPSHELRTWFQHDPEKWGTFRKRYVKELETNQGLIALLTQRMQEGPITFLYAAKNKTRNHALVLKDYLLTLSQ